MKHRHLLEDPATLQSAMETEIRAAFSRISRIPTTAGAGVGDRPLAVRLLTLMSALRPLLIRDGRILVQAASNVLRSIGDFTNADGSAGSSGGGGNGSNVYVTLATPQKNQGPGTGAGDKVAMEDELGSPLCGI